MTDKYGYECWFKESKPTPLEDDYFKGLELGRGATAVVHKCTHIGTGENWAVKIINKRVGKKIPVREISILLKLKHPNIIRLREVYETENQVALVLALVTGGELFDRIVTQGYYSEKDAARCVKDILEGVKYLHENGVVHRDLKPENLLYSDNSPNSPLMVADFGLSVIMDRQVQMNSACGTPGYTAPEVLEGYNYGQAVDMWSVGVITYILLCGYEPFYAPTEPEMFKKIIKGDYIFHDDYWKDVSENAKDLISKMLVLSSKKRLTAADALQHPWVKGHAALSSLREETQIQLKAFNAKRKKKAATHAVIFANNIAAMRISGYEPETVQQFVQK